MNALPYTWRISKYDPALRNAQGHYLADDWTFFAQIGQSFHGKQLTYEDYVSVENAYVHSVMLFLADAELASLQIVELERPPVASLVSSQLQGILTPPPVLRLGGSYDQVQLEDVIRLSLREVIWCKLEAFNAFYLHFGWDYYIYVGSTAPSIKAIRDTVQDGLYVEAKASPHS